MAQKLPVLVVGSGPTGLVSALSLARNDVPVRIIEKRETFHGGIRGTSLMPRTIEALAFLDISDDVIDTSLPPHGYAFYGPDGHTPRTAPWSEGCGNTQYYPFPQSRIVSQSEFEGLLRTHLQRLGVSVETSTELIDFEQFDDKIVARIRSVSNGEISPGIEELVECFAVIAADGARGHTRRQLGLPFVGQTREEDRIISANAYVSGLEKNYWHMWGNMGKKSVGLKPMKTENLFQFQALGSELPHIPLDADGVRKLFYSISGRDDIVIDDATWVSEWRANIRMCEKFGNGRVFLIGDAAHCHSPLGAQGMNSGIQDAVNLSWKLAMVHGGHASMALLETYSEERAPVIAEMLSLSSSLHNLAFGKPIGSTLDSAAGGAAGREKREVDNSEVMRRSKTLLQLGVNYRWSPVVLEAREAVNSEGMTRDPYGQDSDRLRAGDRAPDAKLSVVCLGSGATQQSVQPTTLHSFVDMRKHVILVFTSSTAALEHVGEQLKNIISAYVDSGLASLALVLPKTAEVSAPMPSAVAELAKGGLLHLLVDEEAETRRVYDLAVVDEEATYVVVRPDSVIGAFSGEVAGVRKYFDVLKAGGNRS